jgi:hypothetical protein
MASFLQPPIVGVRSSPQPTVLYVSADADRAAEQLRQRLGGERAVARILLEPTLEQTIEILTEALRGAAEIPSPLAVVAHWLHAASRSSPATFAPSTLPCLRQSRKTNRSSSATDTSPRRFPHWVMGCGIPAKTVWLNLGMRKA